MKNIALGLVLITGTFSAAPLVRAEPTTAPATQPAVDAGNTKCLVNTSEDVGTATADYKGKTYHFCCESCVPSFNKDPEKYISALNADPAKFGVKAKQ